MPRKGGKSHGVENSGKVDQDKINRFAGLDSSHVDLTSDMADKERELENLQVLLIVSFNKKSIEKPGGDV